MLENICEFPYQLGTTQKWFRTSTTSGKNLESPRTAQGTRKINGSEVVSKKKITLNDEKFLVEIRKTKL